MGIRVNSFTDQPYKFKKGLHIAEFSVMTPEQMKHVRPLGLSGIYLTTMGTPSIISEFSESEPKQ